MRKYFRLRVVFGNCQGVLGLNGMQHLGKLLAEQGFDMRTFPNPGEAGVTLKGSEIGTYLNNKWAREIAEKTEGYGKYPIPFGRNLIAHGMEQLQWRFTTSYKDGHVNVELGGLVDFEFSDQSVWLEPYAQRLQSLAAELYQTLRPSLTSVDESDRRLFVHDVVKRKLKYINWVNIFGPAYVAKYGREFLLGLPGYRIEEWPDGSIYYQLSPTFVAHDLKAARALRREVVEYCAQAGLKVTCKAPYQLPDVVAASQMQPQPPDEGEPIPNESVRVYMQEMLQTTLLLKDGTRVKVVSVPWDVLTPVQQRIALDVIEATAIAEIREHRDKRIRFEFNVIPDELDQMMADLAGRGNPDFEWVVVDMGGQA